MLTVLSFPLLVVTLRTFTLVVNGVVSLALPLLRRDVRRDAVDHGRHA